ncbi:MAG: hypothetical protein ACKVIQ_19800 [Acidimicrobiales bacterium]|jgi:hypothetical protein
MNTSELFARLHQQQRRNPPFGDGPNPSKGTFMDFSKLSQNNQIAAGGAVMTLISGFLPWFSFPTIGGIGGGGLMWLGILLTLAGAAVLLMKVFEMQDLKVQGLSAEQLAMVLAALGLAFMLLKVLIGQSPWNRSWGMFVSLIAGGATLAGTFLSGKDVGIGIPTADDFKGSGDDSPSGGTSTF